LEAWRLGGLEPADLTADDGVQTHHGLDATQRLRIDWERKGKSIKGEQESISVARIGFVSIKRVVVIL
jgi:hypothetical protein